MQHAERSSPTAGASPRSPTPDLLAYEMEEAIRPDIELALIRDQVESLKRLGTEELERRMAEARQSA
jgi:hypothetical protein